MFSFLIAIAQSRLVSRTKKRLSLPIVKQMRGGCDLIWNLDIRNACCFDAVDGLIQGSSNKPYVSCLPTWSDLSSVSGFISEGHNYYILIEYYCDAVSSECLFDPISWTKYPMTSSVKIIQLLQLLSGRAFAWR